MLNFPLVWVHAKKPIYALKTALLRKPPILRECFLLRMNLPEFIFFYSSDKIYSSSEFSSLLTVSSYLIPLR